MTANPWDKFFWNDWENDPALRLCSLSAQGLWMRILCICAKADPKGFLVVAGRPLSPIDLSSLTGKPVPEIESLLRELGSNGVYSTDRIGRIYNRRMVLAMKKSRTASKNGKMGGNPTLLKQKGNSPLVKLPDKPPDKPHKPEANSQKPEQEARAREDLSSEINQLNRILGFDESDWAKHAENIRILADLKASGCNFERHIRPAAERAGRGGTKKSLAYIRPRAEELRDAEGLVKSMPTPFVPTDERGWHDRMRGWQDADRWSPKWGPSPDAPGCKCPPEIIAKYAKKDAA